MKWRSIMDKEIQLSGTVGNTIRVPKRVATIKICGGAMTFYIDDTMQWQRPTDEQIKNLKELLAIEVIPEDL
jgi:hypothetical protein